MRDPKALARRVALVLGAALFLVIAGMNLTNLSTILSREEPRRSLRVFLAAASVSFAMITLALLVRDVRGRGIPLAVVLRPAWLIVGLNLVDMYFATHKGLFMVTGGLAIAVGVWGTALLFRSLRRNEAPRGGSSP